LAYAYTDLGGHQKYNTSIKLVTKHKNTNKGAIPCGELGDVGELAAAVAGMSAEGGNPLLSCLLADLRGLTAGVGFTTSGATTSSTQLPHHSVKALLTTRLHKTPV